MESLQTSKYFPYCEIDTILTKNAKRKRKWKRRWKRNQKTQPKNAIKKRKRKWKCNQKMQPKNVALFFNYFPYPQDNWMTDTKTGNP